MKRSFIIAGIIMFVSGATLVTAQERRLTPQEHMMNEQIDAARGLQDMQNTYKKGWRVYQKLVQYSGVQYPVMLAQKFNWGEARPGGQILVDVSIMAKDEQIVAFLMGHEWGHQILGHVPNLYRPDGGSPWRLRATPLREEDEADLYAGQFMAGAGYRDISKALKFLRTSPTSPAGDSHSDGPVRAETVRRAYCGKLQQLGVTQNKHCPELVTDERGAATSQKRRIACTHPAHPQGHAVEVALHSSDVVRVTAHEADVVTVPAHRYDQIVVPAHPRGDLIPCQHACPGPYGPVPCHQADSVPCQHAVPQQVACQHPVTERVPCQHVVERQVACTHTTTQVVPCEHTAHPEGHLVAQ